MTVMTPFIEEYLGFEEWQQGNVNAAGLVWEHEIEDAFGFEQAIYTVYGNLLIEDEFEIAEDFEPIHYAWLDTEIDFKVEMGDIPVDVFHSSINVLFEQEPAPIEIYWMGINVVHGPDTFFETVYAEVKIEVPYSQGAPHWHHTLYESVDIEWHNIEPHRGVHKALKFKLPDYFTSVDKLIPQWDFNSKSLERLFLYDNYKWSWLHELEESFDLDPETSAIIGWMISEWAGFRDKMDHKYRGNAEVSDRVFAWDRALRSRGWTHVLEEEVSLEETVRAYLELILQDWLISEELVKGEKELFFLSEEQFKLADRLVNSFKVQVQDEIGLEDEPLKHWLGKAFLESQADFTTEVTPKSEHDVHVEMKISLDGSLS